VHALEMVEVREEEMNLNALKILLPSPEERREILSKAHRIHYRFHASLIVECSIYPLPVAHYLIHARILWYPIQVTTS
jgi:hypothetical protein